MWRGKPIFIRHRTDKENRRGEGHRPLDDLPAIRWRATRNLPENATADDDNRAAKDREPLARHDRHLHASRLHSERAGGRRLQGRAMAAGSARATARNTTRAGRVRKGPAPQNLAIPPYAFIVRHQDQDRLAARSHGTLIVFISSRHTGIEQWIDDAAAHSAADARPVHGVPDAAQSELSGGPSAASSPSCSLVADRDRRRARHALRADAGPTPSTASSTSCAT